jgi:hypothetical protein
LQGWGCVYVQVSGLHRRRVMREMLVGNRHKPSVTEWTVERAVGVQEVLPFTVPHMQVWYTGRSDTPPGEPDTVTMLLSVST